MKIELNSDKVVIKGPNTDGGYTLTFYVGEYQQGQVVEVLKIPQMTELSLTVEIDKEKKRNRICLPDEWAGQE